jgi:catechol 2,3-dioxygenase-like lactoylglutathione lyase family enzyme
VGEARLGAAVIPSLRARDLRETIAFYGRLGFRLQAARPRREDPQWCELVRDEARLHFHGMTLTGQAAEPALSGTLYFSVGDVRTLAEQWRGKVSLAWGPQVMAYGWREFAFRDPNGYTLAFFEQTTDLPDCPAS